MVPCGKTLSNAAVPTACTVPMTDMGLFSFSLASEELESSSFCLSSVLPGVTDGGNRCSLHSEMIFLSVVKYCCSWKIYGP